MISGSAPMRRAMTGVPQASDSIGHEAERLRPRARHQRGVALGEQLVAVRLIEFAQVLDARASRLQGRAEHVS